MVKDKIIITGGSKGLGRDLALLFIKNNYEVICLSRSKPKYDCIFIETDLTDEISIKKACEIVNNYKFKLLINNAASLEDDYIKDSFSMKKSIDIFNTNVIGPTYLVSQLISNIKSNNADVFNISGICQLDPEYNMVSYSMSKRALSSLSELLREELNNTFSRVSNFILPGMDNRNVMGISTKDIANVIFEIYKLPKVINVDNIEISSKIPKLSR